MGLPHEDGPEFPGKYHSVNKITVYKFLHMYINICESRGPPVFAEYIGRPPRNVADLFHLNMEDIINSTRKEVERKNGRLLAEHKYIYIYNPQTF